MARPSPRHCNLWKYHYNKKAHASNTQLNLSNTQGQTSNMLIKHLIKNIGVELGFTQVLNDTYLKNCHRTNFCWSKQPNSICLSTGKDYLKIAMANPHIDGIITSPKIFAKENPKIPKSIILLEHPDQFFYYLHNAKLHAQFACETVEPFIHPCAQISDKATVSPLVRIGAGTVIHDGAVILDNTLIGNNCVIYQNVTVGTEGFFSKKVLNEKIHIEHFGGVRLGDHCIIHAGCNISRSVNFGDYTTIGNNSHIGIQTNIAHDCVIGKDCDVSAKVCLSGRVRIGNHVWIGAAATISNQIHVHDHAQVKIGAVVIEDVQPAETVSGNFAIRHQKQMRKHIIEKNHAN